MSVEEEVKVPTTASTTTPPPDDSNRKRDEPPVNGSGDNKDDPNQPPKKLKENDDDDDDVIVEPKNENENSDEVVVVNGEDSNGTTTTTDAKSSIVLKDLVDQDIHGNKVQVRIRCFQYFPSKTSSYTHCWTSSFCFTLVPFLVVNVLVSEIDTLFVPRDSTSSISHLILLTPWLFPFYLKR